MTDLLLVDDEPVFTRALSMGLRGRGYAVTTCGSGNRALRRFAEHPPDAVLLDLGLPDMDGIDVLRAVRSRSTVPVVVVSARQGDEVVVAALDAGADDYLTKPFSLDQLVARLRAVLRRGTPSPSAVVRTAEFTIDLRAKRVLRTTGEVVRLTPTEWSILEVLVADAGALVTQRQLLRAVWGPSHEQHSEYLRVYMTGLRRKLERDTSQPRYLITEPGLGYRFTGTEA